METSVENWRKLITLLLAILWLSAASVVDSRWGEDSPFGLLLLAVGYALTGVGAIGRVWCLSYIAGHKNNELITTGPYSMSRNPLYFFSLLGASGVGLGSSTLTFPLLAIVGFSLYYPWMFRAEANRLSRIHGDAYETYRLSTPIFLPTFKHFRESDNRTIQSRAFRKGLFDTFWFFAALCMMHIFAELHHSGQIPAWLILP